MFRNKPEDNSIDKPFISPEEMALLPDRKEASNFITLTPKQRLNILESLLLERVANGENCDDILNAIAMLQIPTQQPSTNRNIAHSFDIPILSEIGDIIKMATVAWLMVGGAMLVILAVNPRFCGEKNGSQFCNQTRLVGRYFVEPKGEN
jgi:hypothetical protein